MCSVDQVCIVELKQARETAGYQRTEEASESHLIKNNKLSQSCTAILLSLSSSESSTCESDRLIATKMINSENSPNAFQQPCNKPMLTLPLQLSTEQECHIRAGNI